MKPLPAGGFARDADETGVFSLDDTLLIHSGTHFAEIAPLWDLVSERYVLAHDLSRCITAMKTPLSTLFQLWKPVYLDTLEHGLRAAAIPLKEAKQRSRTGPPRLRGDMAD